MRRVLMIAYHFPPMAGSSGIQRTLRFVQHLPSLGWEPAVLSIHPRAYERTSNDLLDDVPAGTLVRQAFGLDTARHLSWRGKYPDFMARPDRWASWHIGGVLQGLSMIREFQPDVVWSTYPIATAHAIGSTLHRWTGLPWIADFRDPMAQDDYPTDRRVWESYKRIEEDAMRQARYSVFTTPGAVRTYQQRYPPMAERMVLLENGFDEASFAGTSALPAEPLVPGSLVMLHSGIVYPTERDPEPLFAALSCLRDTGRLREGDMRIRFRAAGHDDLLRSLARRHRVEAFIEICPPVPYREALAEMLRADALLVLQSNGCNDQIPAKVYEYLRAGRPLLCLAGPLGDTAGVVREAGIDSIAPLESVEAIGQALTRFLDQCRRGTAPLPRAESVLQASRQGRTALLAGLLEQAVVAPA